ncbi:uncharacterized protein LY79DRAFT_557910 [Colletotrichum navitas]|uniref:Uncharacterized protein n=1 Tax=Colletotrichum navitas TaxID=681940 RepID=A0AAD8V4E7_9PEZI|nr:uncharacterized protein LY79DRAFT_557910 [Colletotrichum navitas]KAK1585835.1 hypothetical protein LY79DRAFT_557910 [Colletotrichum navitas]
MVLKSILPQSFENVQEAVRWLDLIHNAIFFSSRENPYGEGSDPVSDNRWRREQLLFLGILDGWAAALLPLLRRENHPRCGAPKKTILITSLKIQWNNTYIFVYTSHYHDYQGLREMEPRFRDIVDLATTIVDSPDQAYRVTPLSISGVVLSLFVVANKCRDA